MCSSRRRSWIRSSLRFVFLPLPNLVSSNLNFSSPPKNVAGDLLRAEQNRPDSSYGAMIKEHIKEGIIVPMEVTIKLLENAMRESLDNKEVKDGKPSLFLIDGFPRQMDQAIKFDESVSRLALLSGFRVLEFWSLTCS